MRYLQAFQGALCSYKNSCRLKNSRELRIIIYESHIEKIVSEADQVTIGFRTSGGMGDYIMQLKVYQAIIKLAPDCVMDVIAERPLIAEHIYYGQENLRNIIEGFNEPATIIRRSVNI